MKSVRGPSMIDPDWIETTISAIKMKKEKVEELLNKVKAQDDAHPEHNRQKQLYIEKLEMLIENHNQSLEILRELGSLVPFREPLV
ncbi:MAG: hypothetical protein OEZ29_05695 [Candidatus Bathyarchaeota archaeon]|nr:hypothetical protein [Candidatus Bathyarchaeota archaeon]MDH5780069.1 hypothetical protein [Candidatus Bathyarchaeota archaeon]